ncbi:hypothetical protein K2173_011865 [Erythroxylum novogranatense]|uniref:X8 domain-containing protein n=1 Tax=Erythroxylum novogranatense TaxID=1862640 RepID=A0AAV8T0M9_9ROSI|nr:hypothetical protein K2173_011865 [Erythroxylum novogranatense]
MANLTKILVILHVHVMLLTFNCGMVKFANGYQEKTWCVAKPSSSEAELIANINFACDQVKDCRLIQEGGACYCPNNILNHASVVMNFYYQMMGRNTWNCDFGGSGLIVITDPSRKTNTKNSYAYCVYS